jgi:YebC/PmpR family DNA-binding regulatory protein
MQGTTAGAQDPAVDCEERDRQGRRLRVSPAVGGMLHALLSPPKISPMAGHSKWAQIKHKKAATDAKRGKQFTKLARAITVAAREGGGDPDGNPTLATAVQKARDYSMPKDNIQRATDRGTGAGGTEGEIERAVYEGYGPGGAAILVEALTDNRNRTGADIRHAFDKQGGSLGEPGSVAWIFENRGVVLVDAGRYSEDDLIPAIDAGAEDVSEDGDLLKVVCAAGRLGAVRGALESAGVEIESAELTMEPKTVVEIGGEDAPRLVRLMEALDEQDDVYAVHANFDIPAEVLEHVAA